MTETPAPEPLDPFRRILDIALNVSGGAGGGVSDRDLELTAPDGRDLTLLEQALKAPPETEPPLESLDRFLGRVTRAYVTEVLRLTRGSRATAARILGIDRTTLYRLMKKHGIAG